MSYPLIVNIHHFLNEFLGKRFLHDPSVSSFLTGAADALHEKAKLEAEI